MRWIGFQKKCSPFDRLSCRTKRLQLVPRRDCERQTKENELFLYARTILAVHIG